MYAVIKAGGRQHRVKPGDVIEVELGRAQEPGQEVEFRPLLVVDDDGKAHAGKDAGKAVVVGKLVGEQKGDKVKVFKYRPKSGYARKQGHRQLLTLIEISEVRMGGKSAAKTQAAAASEKAPEVPAEEPAAGPPEKRPTKAKATSTGAAAANPEEPADDSEGAGDEAVAGSSPPPEADQATADDAAGDEDETDQK